MRENCNVHQPDPGAMVTAPGFLSKPRHSAPKTKAMMTDRVSKKSLLTSWQENGFSKTKIGKINTSHAVLVKSEDVVIRFFSSWLIVL